MFAEESDEDLLTVPDVENPSIITNNTSQINNNQNLQKRRRGPNPVDKEYRRLKRYVRGVIIINDWFGLIGI